MPPLQIPYRMLKNMNKQFKLITQHPKPKEVGIGVLNVDQKTQEANFFHAHGDHMSDLCCAMERTRLDFAASHGIMLSGMEHIGFDRTGKSKYRFQEWWLIYTNNEDKS